MTEKYCPVCELVHSVFVEICCGCEGELIKRESSDNSKDIRCAICIDHVELA